MRLPRRVPWISVTELEQLCSWIYTDEHDYDAKRQAISRLSAWKAITPLPHALDSTLAILAVINQDRSQTGSSLALRQSYATAVIRLVNGLVDPLQLGAFARSIASIAKQLGLPAWLVELRHAATHEELPSLSLLREAARQSLSWLLHNYFLPTINPLSSSTIPTPLRPVQPLLKQYKECMKIVTRDASLALQYKSTIGGLFKDIERWIAEAEVVANISMDVVGWESHQNTENVAADHDVKEKWAMERLCDELLSKGGLVPLSKKKRSFPQNHYLPPVASIAIWAPLLQNLQENHNNLSSILAGRICSVLLGGDVSEASEDLISLDTRSDPTFDLCLARWVAWLVEVWDTKPSTDYDLRQEVVITLLRGLNGMLWNPAKNKESALQLLKVLCEGEDMHNMLSMLKQRAKQAATQDWKPSDMNVMQDRLDQLQQMVSPSQSETSEVPNETRVTWDGIVAPGWRQLSSNNWKPCPLGVFVCA